MVGEALYKRSNHDEEADGCIQHIDRGNYNGSWSSQRVQWMERKEDAEKVDWGLKSETRWDRSGVKIAYVSTSPPGNLSMMENSLKVKDVKLVRHA